MTKLNYTQIQEMKELSSKGLNNIEIAKQFNVSLSATNYWTREGYAEKQRRRCREIYKKLTKEQKQKIYKKKKDYMKKYMKNRYHNDPEFRQKHIERVKLYKKKKRTQGIKN